MSGTLAVRRLTELGLPAPDSVQRLDRRARETFAEVPTDPPDDSNDSVEVDPLEILTSSATVLDQWRAFAAIAEAVELSTARLTGEVLDDVEAILARACLLARIDPLAPFLSDPAIMESERARVPLERERPFPLIANSTFVRWVRSLVEFCPIDELVALGECVAKPELGHRCRLSYDWLRSFVKRRSPEERHTLHIVGRAYAEGRLSLNEAANLLSMPRPDAVAWLEENGHARDLKVIALSPEERERRLARIRVDRLERNGAPAVSKQITARDVIATQRIEGVDARPWLQANE